MLKSIYKKVLVIVIILILFIFGYKLYNYLKIKYAKIEVVLKDDLNMNFLEEKKVSDFIESINGTIIDDYLIDSTVVGEKEINFDFINDQNIKVSYSYNINILDNVEPLLFLGDSYKVPVNSKIKLEDKIFCGDNYDSRPNCFIEGDYNLDEVGDYNLVFKAIDKSGNKEEKEFVLHVYEPEKKSNTYKEKITTDFKDVIAGYKNENNKIGIDISSHQGDIDFSLLKDQGVEFIIIRVGYGYDNKNFLDKKFKQNIEEANKYGIDVGIYYYSYADTLKEAKNQANWVLKQIKDYKVTLPIAFDWEEWGNFKEYNLSFFGLTSMAEAFLDTIKSKGYEGMLYSSKNYLDYVWLPVKYDIWLAQYNNKPTYEGKFKMWQMCDNGVLDGIKSAVDIDIMYK